MESTSRTLVDSIAKPCSSHPACSRSKSAYWKSLVETVRTHLDKRASQGAVTGGFGIKTSLSKSTFVEVYSVGNGMKR